jgi:hypothetical protein
VRNRAERLPQRRDLLDFTPLFASDRHWGVMSPYHFFLFRDGEVVGQTNCQCADDIAAFEIGQALSAYQAVEIYSQNRLISRLQHAKKPSPSPD